MFVTRPGLAHELYWLGACHAFTVCLECFNLYGLGFKLGCEGGTLYHQLHTPRTSHRRAITGRFYFKWPDGPSGHFHLCHRPGRTGPSACRYTTQWPASFFRPWSVPRLRRLRMASVVVFRMVAAWFIDTALMSSVFTSWLDSPSGRRAYYHPAVVSLSDDLDTCRNRRLNAYWRIYRNDDDTFHSSPRLSTFPVPHKLT